MKKLIYYPSAGICFLGSFALGRVALMTDHNIPMAARAQLGVYSAGLAVAGTACIKVARQKDTKRVED